MTIFFEGSLQEGIALAVREAKAVVCFVRDDAQLSSTWESDYFSDNQVAQALRAKSVSLRLTAGSQEAGFLASFCPIAEFPAVIVIKNGKPEEYLLPGVSKDEFKNRILAVLGETGLPDSAPVQQPRTSTTAANPNSSPSSASATPSAVIDTSSRRRPSPNLTRSPVPYPQKPDDVPKTSSQHKKQEPPKPSSSTSQAARQDCEQKPKQAPEKKKDNAAQKLKPSAKKPPSPTVEDAESRPPVPRGPPTQYRLQVRLFDGRSIRSSFSPTQTVRNDVRPWLDEQMTEDKRPYNLKHILTPLPSRTLSMTEESQPLQDLGLGSTANLVMVPVASYTEAYASAAASLPARGISAVYNMVSSVASSAGSLVGSFIGYGSSAPENSSPTQAPPSSPPPSTNTRRPRTGGLNIRTLHDQQNERDDTQYYNGNQLNFEPRHQDRKDD